MQKKFIRKIIHLTLLLWLSFYVPAYAKSILIVGDSISAGYGIDVQQGWVALLEQRLKQKFPKKNPQVINASVSGETTSGALVRLPKLLTTYHPDIVMIELGGNDGLRGQSPQLIQQNLAKLVQLSQQQHRTVILLGMKIPPNYGTAYSQAFEQNYQIIAKQYNIILIPFFLEGVAGHIDLMQTDRIHPNAKAQIKLLNLIWAVLRNHLE